MHINPGSSDDYHDTYTSKHSGYIVETEYYIKTVHASFWLGKTVKDWNLCSIVKTVLVQCSRIDKWLFYCIFLGQSHLQGEWSRVCGTMATRCVWANINSCRCSIRSRGPVTYISTNPLTIFLHRDLCVIKSLNVLSKKK